MNQITRKKAAAVVFFLVGAMVAVSPQTFDYPSWASIGAYMAGLSICWGGVALWQSDKLTN
jgi:drug/metabolite transporter (DMT)-like permease